MRDNLLKGSSLDPDKLYIQCKKCNSCVPVDPFNDEVCIMGHPREKRSSVPSQAQPKYRKFTVHTKKQGEQELYMTDTQTVCTTCNGTAPWDGCIACGVLGYVERVKRS